MQPGVAESLTFPAQPSDGVQDRFETASQSAHKQQPPTPVHAAGVPTRRATAPATASAEIGSGSRGGATEAAAYMRRQAEASAWNRQRAQRMHHCAVGSGLERQLAADRAAERERVDTLRRSPARQATSGGSVSAGRPFPQSARDPRPEGRRHDPRQLYANTQHRDAEWGYKGRKLGPRVDHLKRPTWHSPSEL